MKKVQLITDGACHGNPGPGGWAAILRYGGHRKEMFGSSPHTTNNRMEMAAAIEGMSALKQPCEVEIVTDSEYLMKGITVWIVGWKQRNWLTKEKKPVLNKDLWLALDDLVNYHDVRWSWTRGHASHAENNRADELATQAAAAQAFSKGYKRDVQLPAYDLDNGAGSAKAGR